MNLPESINALGFSVELFPIAAGLVSLGFLYVYLRAGKEHFGPDADYWEIVRRSFLPQLNRLARRNGLGYAAYTLGHSEYLGKTDLSPEEFEHRLASMGFRRMPLAAFKYDPAGNPEIGSWAWRPAVLHPRQLHLILFEGEDGGTRVWGHSEPNALNPLTAASHYLGNNYRPLGEYGLKLMDLLRRGPRYVMEEADGRDRQ